MTLHAGYKRHAARTNSGFDVSGIRLRMRYSERLPVFALAVALFLLAAASAGAQEDLPPPHPVAVDFLRDVRPIFEQNCFRCHGREKQESNFRLDRRSNAAEGGDNGIAYEPGNSADSLLIQYVAGVGDVRMPPAGNPLSRHQVAILRRWIDDNAIWPDDAANENGEIDMRLWSLQPIVRPPIPVPAGEAAWVRNPIDAFILTRLQDAELTSSPEADRRTLIRRLTFDLHGLSPKAEEVNEFLKDTRPDAHERLVDRLLASPRYGERWARHWLDVVHYADSHGQDQDRPRPNAWPYRDYLIRSFNEDLPYAKFVEQQVAGDILYPDDPGAIAATGFLAAGPWDESSLRDIREESIDRLIGQNLDRDDIVTNTASTFLGLTVGCARCHDHKFDPISQRDYYALQAMFAGIDKADRRYDSDPAIARRRAELKSELAVVADWPNQQPSGILTESRLADLGRFEETLTSITSAWNLARPVECSSEQGSILKSLPDHSVLAVGDRPEKDTYSVTFETEMTQMTGVRLEVLPDETLPQNGPGRQDNGNLHLSEIRVSIRPIGDESSISVPLKTAEADFDQSGWGVARSIDGDKSTAWGIYPQVGVRHEAVFATAEPVAIPRGARISIEFDQLHGEGHLIGRLRISLASAPKVDPELRPVPFDIAKLMAIPGSQRAAADNVRVVAWLQQRKLQRELDALPQESVVYCGTNQFEPDGTFRPASAPREVRLLSRGEISQPQDLVQPRLLDAIPALSRRYDSVELHSDIQRRAALARWLVDAENPLTFRVIVNRVWLYHFGRGIVDTPNDFGRMGGAPSHPELLDWLAAEFRDSGGSLKSLHRLILNSSTFRQSSQHSDVASEKDNSNRLLWQMSRQRLDAESVRDCLLQFSGQLDLTMYGPPAMHFNMSPGIHVTPNVDYLAFDIDCPGSRRRSVYRFVFRTLPDPWLAALDCPDASQSAPVRSQSVGAVQALALWNNKMVLRQAEHLAELAQEQNESIDGQVRFISSRVLCREPSDAEVLEWAEYSRQYGLANFCRVLFNSSEFLFVD